MQYRVKLKDNKTAIIDVTPAHTAGTWHLVTDDQPPCTLEASGHVEAIQLCYPDQVLEIIAQSSYPVQGTLTIPKIAGTEIAPGVFALTEPTYRPDLGPTSLVCLANVDGQLALVELKVTLQ